MDVYMIPFAGGSQYSFGSFTRLFPADIRVSVMELPGRGGRFSEPLLYCFDDMVTDLVGKMKLVTGRPYVIYGHSMGALLGYLMSRRIFEKGMPMPQHLVVSGFAAPVHRKEKLSRYLLGEEEFWRLLIDLGGISGETAGNEELRAFYEPILRADIQALDSYVYEPCRPMDIPITAIRGTKESTSTAKLLDWQMESSAGAVIKEFEGDHFFIFNHAERIISIICDPLKKLNYGVIVQ